jgi:hypothetical protein
MRNYRNTPVILLAQGDVFIGGTINVSSSAGNISGPGPGGFYGGAFGQNGFGPGGGAPGGSSLNGRWVGSLSLVPIVGGSGGYGGNGTNGGQGGHGGGAIVIASSTTIFVAGVGFVLADGNSGISTGSGGAIRLVANSINVAGHLEALGCCGVGSGVIRLEAPAGSLFFSGVGNPAPIISTTINPQTIADGNTPSFVITSVGGFPVSYTAGRPDFVDLILPNQVSDPINVVVQAHNIPVGTQVNLNISGPANGTFTSGTLSGTQASSSTTIAVSGLSRTGATYMIAFADFTLPGNAASFNKKGPDEIATVRIIAKPGAESKLVFLRKNGTEIALAKVPKTIQQQFGLN